MGYVNGEGLRLTDSGLHCCNPACGAVLYVELMAAPDAEACFECDPEQFREGWHPGLAELFERSGGRLPAHEWSRQRVAERAQGFLQKYPNWPIRNSDGNSAEGA